MRVCEKFVFFVRVFWYLLKKGIIIYNCFSVLLVRVVYVDRY